MGQCYSVSLRAGFKPDRTAEANNALNAYFSKAGAEDRANFSLEVNRRDGLDPSSFICSLVIAFAGTRQGFEITAGEIHEGSPRQVSLTSSFNASYGWMAVMEKAFETLVPFLEDGSELEIWGDSDRSRSSVRDGRLEFEVLEENEE